MGYSVMAIPLTGAMMRPLLGAYRRPIFYIAFPARRGDDGGSLVNSERSCCNSTRRTGGLIACLLSSGELAGRPAETMSVAFDGTCRAAKNGCLGSHCLDFPAKGSIAVHVDGPLLDQ